MPFIPVPDTVLIEFRGTYLGQKVENTLYGLAGDPISSLDLPAFGTDLMNWWIDNLAANIGAGVNINQIVFTDLTTAFSPSFTFVPTSLMQGTQDGEGLPGNVSIVMSFRSSGRGRSSRGRNYIIGLTQNQVVGNQILSGEAEELRAAYALLPDIFTANGFTWVVVSRFTGNAPRTTGVTSIVSAVVVTDLNIDSQRRRLTGRGA